MLGAEFLALFAADASIGANGARGGTLVVVVTHYGDIRLFGYHGNHLARADGGAKSASEAVRSIDMCNAVLQTDRIGRAGIGTIAKAETAETAGGGAAPQLCGSTTGGDAVVACLVGGRFAVTVAMNESNHMANSFRFDTDDLTDLGGYCVSAGNAKIGGCLTCRDGGGVVITSLVSASTTVDAGQMRTDFLDFGILFDTKEARDQSDQDPRHHTNGSDDDKGNQNRVHIFVETSLSKERIYDSGESHKSKGEEGCGNQGDGQAAEGLGNIGLVNAGAQTCEEHHGKQEAETASE